MKRLLLLVIFCLLLYACKKQDMTQGHHYLNQVQQSLQSQLSPDDYRQLNFSSAIRSSLDSLHLYYVRIPFLGKQLSSDFVVLKTTAAGQVLDGRIAHLENRDTVPGFHSTYSGSITLQSLQRKLLLQSDIKDGYILAYHKRANRIEVLPDGNVLPEVVIVAYVRNESYDLMTMFLLNSFFYSDYMGSPNSYFVSADGDNSIGGGGDGVGTLDLPNDPPVSVDVDTYADHPAINIDDYLRCFDHIPDAGAQCQITIYSDIPVDSNPNVIFDWSSGSPGHCFIGIKKTSADGTQIVSQYIGFYPQTGWKTIFTNGPIDGKFVDDGIHEYNASYSKSLTPDELKSDLVEMQSLENAKYSISSFNCTDWALDIFNKQGYKLQIPLLDIPIPGNLLSAGTSTPQGVYVELKQLKDTGAPHSDQISMDFMKGFVAYSSGPCY